MALIYKIEGRGDPVCKACPGGKANSENCDFPRYLHGSISSPDCTQTDSHYELEPRSRIIRWSKQHGNGAEGKYARAVKNAMYEKEGIEGDEKRDSNDIFEGGRKIGSKKSNK